MPYQPTEKQAQAWKLLREGPRHVLLVGGSRSGKTTLIVEEVLCRALKYPGSRHLIARLRFAHAKTSLWLDTIPKVLQMEGVPLSAIKTNASDHYITLSNGSEIWVDGLDDKERVEKILGREYATIHFNEISQINYSAAQMVLTRLAQNIKGCINKAYYDLNPVGRAHWGYKLFIQGCDPVTDEPLPNLSDYTAMTLNPNDNEENLPTGYIEEILDRLPEHKRKRFRFGEWGEPEGVIFTNWEVIDVVPEKVMRHAQQSYGLDFGFSVSPAALIWLGLHGDNLYLDELVYETGLTNQMLAQRILPLHLAFMIRADSAEPKSIKELQDAGIQIIPAAKGPDSKRQGLDWLLGKNIFVTRRSANIQLELGNYVWKTDKNEKALPIPIDDYDHAIDAVRYGGEPFMRTKRIAGSVLRK